MFLCTCPPQLFPLPTLLGTKECTDCFDEVRDDSLLHIIDAKGKITGIGDLTALSTSKVHPPFTDDEKGTGIEAIQALNRWLEKGVRLKVRLGL